MWLAVAAVHSLAFVLERNTLMAIISGGITQPSNGLVPNIITNAGAPGANAYAGQVALGGLLLDTTNAKLYICTATNGTTTSTWTVVGAQT